MSETLLILGRQPALSLAELESLYGAAAVRPVGSGAAVVQVEPAELVFDCLGGSVKAAKVLTALDTTKWDAVAKYLVQMAPEHAALVPPGKLTIGLSAYGFDVSPARVNATGLSIKKAIRKNGDRPVRLVPNNEPGLSSAQTYHNRLTDERAWELVAVLDDKRTILAQVTHVQNIDSYTLRDRGRPKRDTKVGMLPPKLAQIIINLGARNSEFGIRQSRHEQIVNSGSPVTILDPFCGTGVILQEALLMGYGAYGTDLEPRMIEYSKMNVEWLASKFQIPTSDFQLEHGDATTHRWEFRVAPGRRSLGKGGSSELRIASEAYLGRPFTASPAPEVLQQTVSEVNVILKKFLANLHGQLPAGARLCLAIPAWHVEGRGVRLEGGRNSTLYPYPSPLFRHLPLIDQITELGYNQVSFEHVKSQELLYYREDQFTARELLVLTRK